MGHRWEILVVWLVATSARTNGWHRLVDQNPDSAIEWNDLVAHGEISTVSSSEELDPSEWLSDLHTPTPRAIAIHRLSRSLIDLTKDLVSFVPRSPTPGLPRQDTYTRLQGLQALEQSDVRNLLRDQGIAVSPPRTLSCGPGTLHYRTLDGSCNNLQYPCWGKTEEAYQRWLPPDYANGIDEPRRRRDGFPLPSPRQVYQWVSSQFEQTASTTYPHFTGLLVPWGQMLAHEMLLTPTVTVKAWDGNKFKDEKPKCCNTTSPHAECMPIVMNYQDGYYPRGHCMDIVRSLAYTYSSFSCQEVRLGRSRQQMNQLTSFIDASFVYGASEDGMRSLREYGGKGAKLIMDYSSRWSYPIRKDKKCKAAQDSCDRRCFLVGERRGNENPVLGAMHTLWVREHNRLVEALGNRPWSEETKFHVVRKIIGAQMQHVTYGEYLPVILGRALADTMRLAVPGRQPYRYDPLVNPTLYNVFATAAYRYGHSMVDARLKRQGKRMQGSPLLSHDFFSMDEFCAPRGDPVATLLSGQAEQSPQMVDCLFSRQLTNHLFAKEPGGMGLDLFSINVQRGRDHGLPSYNRWRQACGLPKARDYVDLRANIPGQIVDRLQAIYGPGNVDDIDLYVGGVSEIAVNDGILGATFTCIVANQFKNLKFGDRFWYENVDHPGAFTNDQIKSLQKTSLSALLCRNSDIREIQQKAFMKESASNPKLPCEVILQRTELDIRLWP